MPTTSSHPVLPLQQLHTDWRSLGRSPAAVGVLHLLAARDPALSALVLGSPALPPACPTPADLVAHMHDSTGRHGREQAAAVVRLMLREAALHPLIPRFLTQALLPGLVTVAGKLQWGRGGDWSGGDEFFAELLSTTWMVIGEWAGQDRPYAVLDLLSAIRCRLRRLLFNAKDLHHREVHGHGDELASRPGASESDLESLARLLVDLHGEGMRAEEVQILYAQHVLGYSIAELAAVTGRNRRALYARRDRGQRRLCA